MDVGRGRGSMSTNFTNAEKDAIANTIVDSGINFSKTTYWKIAISFNDPNRIPKPESYLDYRVSYLNDLFKIFNDEELLNFLSLLVKRIKPKSRTEKIFDPETDKEEEKITDSAITHQAFIDELNRNLSRHNIIMTFEGEFEGITETTLLKVLNNFVFDLMEKYELDDIKTLLGKSYKYCNEGNYNDSVFNSGKSIEGVMKKVVISISSYTNEENLTEDLESTIGKLMKKLVNEGFWEDDKPIYKTAKVFRKVFRNVSSHYSTENRSMRLFNFNRSEALFAYYMSLTIISYLLERLNSDYPTVR